MLYINDYQCFFLLEGFIVGVFFLVCVSFLLIFPGPFLAADDLPLTLIIASSPTSVVDDDSSSSPSSSPYRLSTSLVDDVMAAPAVFFGTASRLYGVSIPAVLYDLVKAALT